MHPALPPSSSATRFLPARAFSAQPAAAEPVKVKSLKRSSSTSGASRLGLHRKNADRLRRIARARHHIGQHQRHQRSLGRGLQHDRAAGGQCRRDLVRHQVQRKIEGRNRRHRPQRHPAQQPQPVGARPPARPAAASRRSAESSPPPHTGSRMPPAPPRRARCGSACPPPPRCIAQTLRRAPVSSPAMLARAFWRSYAGSLRVTANALSAAAMACSTCSGKASETRPTTL